MILKKITQGGVDVATKNDIQKNIAYLKLNESSTLTWDAWTDVKVPLEKQLIIGDKLTFDNNRVKIGAGVSKVRVTGNIRFDCLVATGAISAKTHITKADETVSVPITTFNTKPNTTVDFTETIPECIVEVSEGDVIGIAFQTGTANSSKNLKAGTNLIVEVIE